MGAGSAALAGDVPPELVTIFDLPCLRAIVKHGADVVLIMDEVEGVGLWLEAACINHMIPLNARSGGHFWHSTCSTMHRRGHPPLPMWSWVLMRDRAFAGHSEMCLEKQMPITVG